MLRFAFHGLAQSSQVCTRGHAITCRGSLRVQQLKKHNRFADRRPDVNVQPSTDRRRGFLPTLNDRVSTPGVSR